MSGLSSADHSVSPPIITIPRDVQRGLRSDRAQPCSRPRRQDRLHRRRRPLHVRPIGGMRQPRCQRADRPGSRDGGPDHAGPSRHHRLPERVPGRHQGRHRAGRSQHPADQLRLQVHARGQPREGAGGVGAASAEFRACPRRFAVPQAHHRLRQGFARASATAGLDGRSSTRRSQRRRPPATMCASGSTRRAPPVLPRVRCIFTPV